MPQRASLHFAIRLLPREKIGKGQGTNENSPQRAEIKVRKNEMKLRKKQIKVPKNFLMPPWRVSFASVGDSDFPRAVGSWFAGRAQVTSGYGKQNERADCT